MVKQTLAIMVKQGRSEKVEEPEKEGKDKVQRPCTPQTTYQEKYTCACLSGFAYDVRTCFLQVLLSKLGLYELLALLNQSASFPT